MASRDSANSAGVTVSSQLNLKALTYAKEQEVLKNKAAGKTTVVTKRPDKKTPKWKSNTGVEARAARDRLEEVSKRKLADGYAKLVQKAKVYDKIKRGEDGGLTDRQQAEVLVVVDDDDIDESLTVPVPLPEEEDDPIIEYQDELGRDHTAPRSQVPIEFLPRPKKQEEDDPFVIRQPFNHHPVYEPDAERRQMIDEKFKEEPLNTHYDHHQEVRDKAAGFYGFDANPESRGKQFESLRKIHQEAERNREELRSGNVRPEEVQGMRADEQSSAASVKSRAVEKRKRELEARRKEVQDKRQKTGGKVVKAAQDSSTSTVASTHVSSTPLPATSDPFAMLDAQSKGTNATTHTPQHVGHQDSADAFLARLEQEIPIGQAR
ncbi:hypothetical protein C8Q74DRAFT_1366737 [Fomes fomentarius]|nr:hypothetical protein C8Q74DRAFT_1366737 [Fomes fomentarius]